MVKSSKPNIGGRRSSWNRYLSGLNISIKSKQGLRGFGKSIGYYVKEDLNNV